MVRSVCVQLRQTVLCRRRLRQVEARRSGVSGPPEGTLQSRSQLAQAKRCGVHHDGEVKRYTHNIDDSVAPASGTQYVYDAEQLRVQVRTLVHCMVSGHSFAIEEMWRLLSDRFFPAGFTGRVEKPGLRQAALCPACWSFRLGAAFEAS